RGRLAEVVAGGVAGGVVGHRRGEYAVEPGSLRAALDLFAPVGVNLAGPVHVEAQGFFSLRFLTLTLKFTRLYVALIPNWIALVATENDGVAFRSSATGKPSGAAQ